MMKLMTAMTAAMLLAAAGAAQGQDAKPGKGPDTKAQAPAKPAVTLKEGDKAPALSVEEWVKGDKVESFQKGKVYIVEFWATWCGPCIKGIPHLTAVQKEYKDKGVTILSIAASERPKDREGNEIPVAARLQTVKDFVTKQGDEMGYTVAFDADRSMSEAWMRAAGQNGIPCAFIVDKAGTIAWIGHPGNGMDEALKNVLAGKPARKAGGSAQAGAPAVILAAQPEKAEKKDDKAKAEPKAKKEAEKGPTLYMGDKAPAINVSKWVKGEPVKGFEKGKTYVVEFWATWCGPCIENIPHLTELQKEHKDVRVVGVSVWESDQSKVEPFVEKMGEKMEYTVAMDDVPAADGKPGKGMDGKMAKNWLGAAGQNGIPCAFIVNGDGKVAWIGHPASMEEPLEKILAGKWDLEKEAAEYRKSKEMEEKIKPLARKVQQSLSTGDFDTALTTIDELIALDPKAANQYAMPKFMILLTEAKQYDKAYAYGAELVDGPFKDNSQYLNQIAWTIVDPEGPDLEKRDLKLALKAAQRANELTNNEDPAILDTLAKVYHDSKDMAKALELQEKAAKLSEGTQFEEEIKGRLEEYKNEAKKKGG